MADNVPDFAQLAQSQMLYAIVLNSVLWKALRRQDFRLDIFLSSCLFQISNLMQQKTVVAFPFFVCTRHHSIFCLSFLCASHSENK